MECNHTMLILTEDEMLNLWKLKKLMIPTRRDCAIERDDGIDIDQLLLLDIRGWYAALLAKGEAYLLPTADLSEHIVLTPINGNTSKFILPSNCCRPLELKLSTWNQSVFDFHAPNSFIAKSQRNEYMRAGEAYPICVQNDDEIIVSGYTPNDTITLMKCVIRPENNKYIFAESCLELIK